MTFTAAEVADLNNRVDTYCIGRAIPLYGYDDAHVCGKECTVLGKFPKFICVHSRKLHLCGAACKHSYSTSEGTFCQLSGYELYGPDDSVANIIVRDSGGRSTRHWGESQSKCGKRSRVKRSMVDYYSLFEKAVIMFFSSAERQQIYDYELERYKSAVARAVKRHGVAITTVNEAAALVRGVWAKHCAQCAVPLNKNTRWLPALAKKIMVFWQQTNVAITRKSVPSLAAVALSYLARPAGYSLNGVVYVRPSPTIANHTVTDMQFGKFNALTCRRMSIVVRALMKSLLTQEGQQRIIKPLEFGTV